MKSGLNELGKLLGRMCGSSLTQSHGRIKINFEKITYTEGYLEMVVALTVKSEINSKFNVFYSHRI